MVVFLLAVVILVVVEVMLKSNPRNSVFAWKDAFRGLLFQAVIIVVVFLLVVVVLVVVEDVEKRSPK